jgi:hypothetical protein
MIQKIKDISWIILIVIIIFVFYNRYKNKKIKELNEKSDQLTEQLIAANEEKTKTDKELEDLKNKPPNIDFTARHWIHKIGWYDDTNEMAYDVNSKRICIFNR